MIAQIDPHQDPEKLQDLQAQVLALQGRGGDTEIAHVTPGELVIPKRMCTPELMAALTRAARQAGIDPARLVVGDPRNSVNLKTGQAEFADPLPPLQSLAGFQPNFDAPPVTGADLGPIAQAMGLGGPDGPNTHRGFATYYNLPGEPTATGRPFDPNISGAAMYRPGQVRIGDTANVRMQKYASVTVPINDSGPFLRGLDDKAVKPLQPDPNYLIDLTPKSFVDLTGDERIGKVPVVVDVTPRPRRK